VFVVAAVVLVAVVVGLVLHVPAWLAITVFTIGCAACPFVGVWMQRRAGGQLLLDITDPTVERPEP
jgi:hypothetical protein